MSLSLAQVAEIRARAEKATPGPWEQRENIPYTHDGVVVFSGRWESNYTVGRWGNRTYLNTQNNVDFIAAARTDVPCLCDTVEAQARRIAELEVEVERLKNAIWPGLPKFMTTEAKPQQDFHEALIESFRTQYEQDQAEIERLKKVKP